MVEKMSQQPLPGDAATRLEWIKVKDELNTAYGPEGHLEKFSRKTKMNPLVPIGCLATVGCLVYGLYNFKQGNQLMSQKMMRYRVAAQGFTVVAILISVAFSAVEVSKDD